MTKFKLGDVVRVINRTDACFDRVGRITSISKDANHRYPFRVSGILPWPLCYGPHELILADPHHDIEGQQLVQAIHDRKEKTL